jgi:spore maturation protein CgeB
VRVLIVDTCYPSFLKSHYRRSPSLEAQSYATQWRALMDRFFGTADAYSHNLSSLGHEAHEFVVNCSPLQSAWAREHDLAIEPNGSEEAILIEQARDFEPDVVYVQPVHYLADATLAELKRHSRLLVGQIATEPPSLERLRAFDLIVTCLPSFVARFSSAGIRTELLPLAFDDRALHKVSGEGRLRPVRDAVFVGSLGRTQHRRSNGMLARAARQVPIEFWGYGGHLWPPWSPVKRGYRGEAWGTDMYRILGEARVAINRHGSIAGPYAVNMRLYEATGMGTLLVTDNGEHLGDLFVPGEEAVSYATTAELVDRVRYFLKHEDERAEVAAAGQARTLRDHTYGRRMNELAAMLEEVAA